MEISLLDAARAMLRVVAAVVELVRVTDGGVKRQVAPEGRPLVQAKLIVE